MTDLYDLRSILYKVLESLSSNEPISDPTLISQQLGVTASNSARKDGINIIQLQNVHMGKIVPHLIDALKLLDALNVSASIIDVSKEEPKQIEHKQDNFMEELCHWLYDKETKYKEMLDIMRVEYIKYVTSNFATRKEAAEFLGISQGYLNQALRGQS